MNISKIRLDIRIETCRETSLIKALIIGIIKVGNNYVRLFREKDYFEIYVSILLIVFLKLNIKALRYQMPVI